MTSFFGRHMVCQCFQRTHGVLMYRRGSALAEVLSKTLTLLPKSTQTLLGCNTVSEKYTHTPEDKDEQQELLSVCDTIYDKIHEQIRHITNRDRQSPYDISSLSVELCVNASTMENSTSTH